MPICSLVLFSQLIALGEGHDGGGAAGGRPTLDAHDLEHDVKGIFASKCQSCHEGDGKFTDANLPEEAWKKKVFDALNHQGSVKPMPPSTAEQLSEAEVKKINDWAGFGAAAPSGCAAIPTEPSPAVIRGIFADRCVTCHGKLSFNPTSVLRPGHHQFLNNSGNLDRAVLGDMSELEPNKMPESKTSLGRIMEALSNYTMPPRANLPVINHPSNTLLPEIGTPEMTVPERNFAIRALKAWIQKENCPPRKWTQLSDAKTKKPYVANYADVANQCGANGMRVPTAKQMEMVKEKMAGEVPDGTCVWTTTFHASSTKDRALRKALLVSNGQSTYVPKEETASCLAVCAE